MKPRVTFLALPSFLPAVIRRAAFAGLVLILLLAAGADHAQTGRAAKADLINRNGNILAMDEGQPNASAVAIRDGKFVRVGTDKEVMRYRGPQTRVVDAAGRRVVPGLNDSHIHVIREGRFYNLELRWDGVKSLEVGLDMIREQAARTRACWWPSQTPLSSIPPWPRGPYSPSTTSSTPPASSYANSTASASPVPSMRAAASRTTPTTTPPPIRWPAAISSPCAFPTTCSPRRAARNCRITANGWTGWTWSTRTKKLLDRQQALRLYTLGSAGLTGEADVKGVIKAGQLAVLTADYLSVPEDEIPCIESVLTLLGGKVVYSQGEYEKLAPPALPVSPAWSPAAVYNGWGGAKKGQ